LASWEWRTILELWRLGWRTKWASHGPWASSSATDSRAREILPCALLVQDKHRTLNRYDAETVHILLPQFGIAG
jgi:hypothetical protein